MHIAYGGGNGEAQVANMYAIIILSCNREMLFMPR